eukprot:TRINITY_DN74967_c0_g1_i1.p3 TRINITY_DN74967_c0_g1~~TRINITY_DN74967_c0_g1_i1.p3  ORF type:complete len:161 (+),score=18.53 TRINITY_DN74967_c0_g1_i1:639-1121(+)
MVFVLVSIVFARLMMVIALVYYGSTWIVYSKTIQDVLLNGLALTFVYDIDDIIYQACVLQGCQNACKSFRFKRSTDVMESFAFLRHAKLSLESCIWCQVVGVPLILAFASCMRSVHLLLYQDMITLAWCSLCGDFDEAELCEQRGYSWQSLWEKTTQGAE